MWIVKWVASALLIILILGFALQNQHQIVQVYILHWVSPEMPLYLIIYIAFAFGMFTWLVASIFKILQLKSECSQLRKRDQQLQEELNQLRNLSVEEAVISEQPGSKPTV